ncbi:hypothetical protein [Actinacidiphila oryziradicis]|uniref:Uncharacterized protein n=1 Tax=Actinacidiphila oryziradicis TaxID=2571141 RepID=A0A4U0RJS3_9ACTN|nr:hypothetical protein [Actinacidiphila oryziradicis]TJZ95875.1 hypothetical protein FCI23_51645 [Actinacidiphila oryziradicis]
MTTTTDLVIPALQDARDAQAAVVEKFQAHIAVTPAGGYRRILERHVADAEEHVSSIDEHMDQLRPHGLLQDALDGARHLAGQAIQVARLPLDVAMAVPAGVLRGRGRAAERQLLKNAEDEYATTALAVATCRAGESIAQEADDAAGADLLGSIRRHDEELLQKLADSLKEQAGAVVAAANGGRGGAEWAASTGAGEAVRGGWSRLRETVEESGRQAEQWEQRAERTLEGAVGRLPGVSRMRGEVQGAAAAEDELPIPGYGELTVVEVTGWLRHLSQAELATIDGYERAHAGRSTILNKIADLRGDEPWPGYDSMKADEIRTRLREADADLARQVLDYERRHQERTTVTTAADHAAT